MIHSCPMHRGENPIDCLTQKQAELRSFVVLAGSVSYDLTVKLLKGDMYQGVLRAGFFALQDTDDIFLDFTGKLVLGVKLNGVDAVFTWDGNVLTLSGVKQGRNEVLVYYENKYDNDGNGLHSFIDEDGKQYLYTNLAVIYCRRVFPCFDQPDLKSSLTLHAIAPKDWIVLSNEPAGERQSVKVHSLIGESANQYVKRLAESVQESEEYYLVKFPESKPLSSYLFGIMAGPYKEIKCENTYNNIPMSLFTRESLMVHLARISDFLFEVTNKCMAVYEDLFQYPFPFSKYDQIYVPEFNWGAMENAGIVTFNDIYVYREEVDSVKLTRLANTTSHELSHHWFGNLVTMKWWNDVWLNESFADFISHYCLSQITTTTKPMSDIWVAFNARKAWGYRTDEQVTTHPIAGLVPDTNTAETVFDGITYAKGAATLRQLFSLVSVEHFSSAMKEYFTKYAYKNTTLDDFINTVDKQFTKSGSSFSLSEWASQWIEKAGLNKCCAHFNPDDRNEQATLTLKQTAVLDIHPTLRKHKMQIAFFNQEAHIANKITILLQDRSETVIHYDASKEKFEAALPNYNDEAFIKIAFDTYSIKFFKENLYKIDCELSRTLIWQAFYNMVRDGELSSEEYIQLFVRHIEKEKSDGLIGSQLTFLETAFASFTPGKYQKHIGDILFDFIYQLILTCDNSQTNKRLSLTCSLPSFARSERCIAVLLDWYHGRTPAMPAIGIKTRWSIVQTVYSNKDISMSQKEALLKLQCTLDTSDQVPLYSALCKSVITPSEERQALWENILDPKNPLSTRTLEYALSGFRVYPSEADAAKFHLKWIESLQSVFTNCKRELFKAFVTILVPSQEVANEEFNAALSAELLQPHASDVIVKALLECKDSNTRKQKAVKTFTENTSIVL